MTEIGERPRGGPAAAWTVHGGFDEDPGLPVLSATRKPVTEVLEAAGTILTLLT
ncbi:hypothetical protein [Amycolatopsis rubida]|uniref:Uncharacterized protein n=1 Tax=Amycolatopsis rubida TaxID=112413 RepID=A0A1I5KHX8_9PSEU|nr:hypothetical protein [Amycolatopsis rubida]SFO84669.1 hypothetical protein SAMN05421854_103204 [Amycolatopsis rubida]